MKKTLKTMVTANVTYENNGKMEVTPVFKHEIFEEKLNVRARVKLDKQGNAVVTPVQEGKVGSRYDILLDTSCGCVKATQDKLIIQLAFPKKLGKNTISKLLKGDIKKIASFLRIAELNNDSLPLSA